MHVVNGAGENLVGRNVLRSRIRHDPIDDHRLVVELYPREQMLVCLRQGLLAVGRFTLRGAGYRQISIWNDQRTEHATEMLDALPDEVIEPVGAWPGAAVGAHEQLDL